MAENACGEFILYLFGSINELAVDHGVKDNSFTSLSRSKYTANAYYVWFGVNFDLVPVHQTLTGKDIHKQYLESVPFV